MLRPEIVLLLFTTVVSGHILPIRPIGPIVPVVNPLQIHLRARLAQANIAAQAGLAAQAGFAAQARMGALAAAGAQQSAAAQAAANVARNAAAASEQFAANARHLSTASQPLSPNSGSLLGTMRGNQPNTIVLAPGERVTIPVDNPNYQGSQFPFGQGANQGFTGGAQAQSSFDPAFSGGNQPPYDPAFSGGNQPPYDPAFSGGNQPPFDPALSGGNQPQFDPAYPGGNQAPYDPAYQGGAGAFDPAYSSGPLRSPMPTGANAGSRTSSTATSSIGTTSTQGSFQGGSAGSSGGSQLQGAAGQTSAGSQPIFNPANTAPATRQEVVQRQASNVGATNFIDPVPGATNSITDPFAGGIPSTPTSKIVTINTIDAGVGNQVVSGTNSNFQPLSSSLSAGSLAAGNSMGGLQPLNNPVPSGSQGNSVSAMNLSPSTAAVNSGTISSPASAQNFIDPMSGAGNSISTSGQLTSGSALSSPSVSFQPLGNSAGAALPTGPIDPLASNTVTSISSLNGPMEPFGNSLGSALSSPSIVSIQPLGNTAGAGPMNPLAGSTGNTLSNPGSIAFDPFAPSAGSQPTVQTQPGTTLTSGPIDPLAVNTGAAFGAPSSVTGNAGGSSFIPLSPSTGSQLNFQTQPGTTLTSGPIDPLAVNTGAAFGAPTSVTGNTAGSSFIPLSPSTAVGTQSNVQTPSATSAFVV